MGSRTPGRRRTLWIVAALTAVGAVARVAEIGQQSYWFDEAHTVWLVHFPLHTMLARVRTTETSPPLYFILAWLWARVFGDGEAALRSLSALAGVLTVPVAYAAGAQLLSRRAGFIVAALTACNPLLVWYSQEARSYSLMVLLTSVAVLAFAHLHVQPTRRWMAIWTLAAVLAVATHYYAALAVIPQGIWLLARNREHRLVRLGVELAVVGVAPVAALVPEQLRVLGTGGNWIVKVSLLHRAADVPRTFVVGPHGPAGTVLMIASAVSVGLAGWLVGRRADAAERCRTAGVAWLGAGGAGIAVALIVLGADQLNYRNVLALWLPIALLVAAGLGVRRAGWRGMAGVGVLCAVGAVSVVGVVVNPRLQRPDWRAVAASLGSRSDRAILTVNGCQLLPLSLYLPGLRMAERSGTAVREIDVISTANQTNWYSVLFSGGYVICRPQNQPVPVPRRVGAFRVSGPRTSINEFSVVRLRSSTPVHVTSATFSKAGLPGALMVQQPASPGPAAGWAPVQPG